MVIFEIKRDLGNLYFTVSRCWWHSTLYFISCSRI